MLAAKVWWAIFMYLLIVTAQMERFSFRAEN
jgi:hypothetical protein